MLAGSIALSLAVTPALAQDAGSVEGMQRVIEAQQRQIEAQQKQLESMQESLAEQTRMLRQFQSQLELLATDSDQQEIQVAAALPPAEPAVDAIPLSKRSMGLVSQRDKHDLDNPSGSNVTYFDVSARGMIPDAQTSVAVHGLIEFQMFHDTTGLDNNRFDTAFIPVDGAPSQTKFNVNPTQLAVSTATSVTSGKLNTWLSIDMNGQLDKPEPRLRIAFAEYVDTQRGLGVLGGQTYSTMLDMRAVPETLDFALPAGLWQQRQPLLRLSNAFGDSLTTEISLETPENVTYTEAQKRTRWPDLALAGTWLTSGAVVKHIRLAALARDLRAKGLDGTTDSALGWAVSGSTKLGLPALGARDNLKLTMHYGDGYGTQLKGGPLEGVYNLESSELETIGVFGTYGGIQHFWSDRFRSNLVFGYVEADNPEFVQGNTFKSTTYIAADIIWNPFKTTTLGFEYLWGEREEENGESGTSNRFLLSSKFQF